jgi:hypothetical protein
MERSARIRVGDHGASVKLDSARGKSGDFRFTVETHDDGTAGAVDITKRFGEPGDAERVKAGGGLVEEENRGAMDQSPRDSDALAHAAGEGAHGGSTALVEANFVEKLFGTSHGLRNILEPGEEDEVFLGSEFVVHHGGVSHVTGPAIAASFFGSVGEKELPCRGTNDAGGNAKESGFSGAIATGKDDAFARRNLKGDAAKREKAAVAFIDVFKPQTG